MAASWSSPHSLLTLPGSSWTTARLLFPQINKEHVLPGPQSFPPEPSHPRTLPGPPISPAAPGQSRFVHSQLRAFPPAVASARRPPCPQRGLCRASRPSHHPLSLCPASCPHRTATTQGWVLCQWPASTPHPHDGELRRSPLVLLPLEHKETPNSFT